MSDRPLSDHPFCQQEQEPNCFDCGDACATCAKEIERLQKGWESLEWESKQEIERLQDTVTMLRNDLQNLRGRFLPGSFEQKMIDDALKYSKREALRDE